MELYTNIWLNDEFRAVYHFNGFKGFPVSWHA